MNPERFYYCFFFIFLSFSVLSQSPEIDSLQGVLKSAIPDTERVKTLNILGREYKDIGEYDKTLGCADEALRILAALPGERKNNKTKNWEARALTNIGLVYRYRSNYPQALSNYFKSLHLKEETGDKNGQAISLDNIGTIYLTKGDYPKALDFYFRALKLNEEINNKKGQGNNYGNIGSVYLYTIDYAKALEFYMKALHIAENINDKSGQSSHMSNIGIVYMSQGHFSKALTCYQKSYQLDQEVGDKQGLSASLNNIGIIYSNQADSAVEKGNLKYACESKYPLAIQTYFKALDLCRELGDLQGQATDYGNIGAIYVKTKKYPEAEKYLLMAISLSDSIREFESMKEFSFNISELYTARGKWHEAMTYYKKYVIAKDSLSNEANTQKQTRLEMQFEFDKKESATKLEQERKEAITAAESRRQKIILFAISGFGFLILVFAIFIYRGFLEKKKANEKITRQKHIIEEKQKEILDSIYYARRIQRSLLTSERYIGKQLKKLR